ncbi:MAG TPA: prolipoprotein diacylglyceryl transferase family protein [Pirellulales bacterium]|nr:prolipoprotein diacylglyceryl transferase family protein [Pirellulales bacterium]
MTYAYPAIMTAAIAAAYLLSRRRQGRLPLTAGQRLGLALGAFCGAMIAAKLPFVLSDWQGLMSGSAWLDNGKTIVFGLVGGYFGVELAKWALDIRVKTGDSFAVPVAVGIAIGRLACFAGGCCYGTPTSLPWGVDFGDGPRHPTQLYETAFHLSAAACLLLMERWNLCRGQRIKLYIMAYLLYRFATEFIRPEPRLWLSLTGYQWACLAWLPVFAMLWWRDDQRIAELLRK